MLQSLCEIYFTVRTSGFGISPNRVLFIAPRVFLALLQFSTCMIFHCLLRYQPTPHRMGSVHHSSRNRPMISGNQWLIQLSSDDQHRTEVHSNRTLSSCCDLGMRAVHQLPWNDLKLKQTIKHLCHYLAKAQ